MIQGRRLETRDRRAVESPGFANRFGIKDTSLRPLAPPGRPVCCLPVSIGTLPSKLECHTICLHRCFLCFGLNAPQESKSDAVMLAA